MLKQRQLSFILACIWTWHLGSCSGFGADDGKSLRLHRVANIVSDGVQLYLITHARDRVEVLVWPSGSGRSSFELALKNPDGTPGWIGTDQSVFSPDGSCVVFDDGIRVGSGNAIVGWNVSTGRQIFRRSYNADELSGRWAIYAARDGWGYVLQERDWSKPELPAMHYRLYGQNAMIWHHDRPFDFSGRPVAIFPEMNSLLIRRQDGSFSRYVYHPNYSESDLDGLQGVEGRLRSISPTGGHFLLSSNEQSYLASTKKPGSFQILPVGDGEIAAASFNGRGTRLLLAIRRTRSGPVSSVRAWSLEQDSWDPAVDELNSAFDPKNF